MSKKTIKKTTKPLSPRPAVKQDDTVYLVREDLDAEQERLRSTPGPEAGPLQAPAPAQAADQPPAPAVVEPAKPEVSPAAPRLVIPAVPPPPLPPPPPPKPQVGDLVGRDSRQGLLPEAAGISADARRQGGQGAGPAVPWGTPRGSGCHRRRPRLRALPAGPDLRA